MVHRTHYLRLLRTLVKNQGPYLAPAGRTRGAAPEEFAAAAQETWNVMQNKWRTIPGGLDLMLDEAHPLGFWRRVIKETHDIQLPTRHRTDHGSKILRPDLERARQTSQPGNREQR